MFNVKSHHKKMVCYLTAVKGNLNFAQNRILNILDNNCMSTDDVRACLQRDMMPR